MSPTFSPVDSRNIDDSAQNISSIDPKLSRTNYYDGRLLKASDLIRDQLYLDERLREVGRASGFGVVRGLDLSFDGASIIRVSPGLAVAPSGRVLELEERELEINLFDQGLIGALNPGFRRLNRGLYALVLQYAEVGEGSAEIYPRDLEGERGFHFNAYAEGVELVLVELSVRSNARRVQREDRVANAVFERAHLSRQLILNDGPLSELPEDGIALGMISIENGRIDWMDSGLVRRAHRAINTPGSLQRDLHQHYEELLVDILNLRREGARLGEFPASQYFSVLPPYGSVPREAIDPENGRQGYFPEDFEVSIAPVRKDDLKAVLSQSVLLEPIDLARDKDVDIMLLVPMSDHQFAWRARQLEHELGADPEGHSDISHMDALVLRFYDKQDNTVIDTDSAVWRAIWAETDELIYVRRPTRVAETHVSAVVLAQGYETPADPSTPLPPDMEAIAQERDALQGEITALQSEIDDLQAQLATSADDRLIEATERIAALEAEILALNTRLAEAEANSEVISELQAQIESLREQLATAEAEIAALRENNQGDAELLARIASLNAELATANATIQELLENQGGGGFSSIEELVAFRGVSDENALTAASKLESVIGGDAARLEFVSLSMMLVGKEYDTLLWPTLLDLAENSNLKSFADFLGEAVGKENLSVPRAVLQIGPQLNLSSTLIAEWQRLALIVDDEKPSLTIDRDRLLGLETQSIVSVAELAESREFSQATVVTNLTEFVEQSDEDLKAFNQAVNLVDNRYDDVLWSSLQTIAKSGNTQGFRDYLVEVGEKGISVGMAVAASGTRFGLSTQQRNRWADLDLNARAES